MKVLAFYSIKGGVGKTAASVNLAHLSAMDGYKTLFCDLDPQGSATYYFRIRPKKKYGAKKLLDKTGKVDDFIRGTDFRNLDLLPSDFSFRNMDIELENRKKSRERLSIIFKSVGRNYELIFIDCPPNITLVSENVFMAADHILIPIIPTTLSQLTYAKLIEFLEESRYDRKKVVPFFSMVDGRKKLHMETMEKMARDDPGILKNYIPHISEIEKMGIEREPVTSSHRKSRGSRAFEVLWDEIKSRLMIHKGN